MKEENSKLVVTIIVLASLLLSVYLSAVVVAVVKDVSVITVIHNWQSWTLDFLKSLIEQQDKIKAPTTKQGAFCMRAKIKPPLSRGGELIRKFKEQYEAIITLTSNS